MKKAIGMIGALEILVHLRAERALRECMIGVACDTNGPAIIDTLREAISGIIAINPKDSKVARLEAISPQIEAGDVFLPETAPWIHDFIEEFLMFPNGVNDDQVDTATQALNYLARNERAGQVASVGETIYGSGNYGFSDRTGIASSTSSGGRIF